jgi:hypothetical protein
VKSTYPLDLGRTEITTKASAAIVLSEVVGTVNEVVPTVPSQVTASAVLATREPI